MIERLGAAKAAAVEIVEGATEKPIETETKPAKEKAAKPAAKSKKAKAEDVAEADA